MIAIVTTYIAWQQWKTNKQKLLLDHFDRRFRIYEEVQKFLLIIMSKTEFNETVKFHASISEAEFLFGSEIHEYIEEIIKHGLNLQLWFKKLEQPESCDNIEAAKNIYEESMWLTDQCTTKAKEKFKKYLNLTIIS